MVFKENCTTGVYRFSGLSRTCINFQDFSVLENARIKFQDFPGFPGPVRTLQQETYL